MLRQIKYITQSSFSFFFLMCLVENIKLLMLLTFMAHNIYELDHAVFRDWPECLFEAQTDHLTLLLL